MKAYIKKLTVFMLAVTLVLSGFVQPIWANAEETNEIQTETQIENTTQKGEENLGGNTAENNAENLTNENDENVNPAPKKFAQKSAPAPAVADTTGELSGTGTADDPYVVDSAEDLKLVAEKVNTGDTAYKKATYKLTDNINLNGSKDNQWTPIGTKENAFVGTFIGTGYTISNLYIDKADLENAGLFGYIASPAKLDGITLNSATVTAKSNVGAIAGAAYTGTAENCAVTGKINVKGNYKVGGMFGGGYVKLFDCKVKGTAGSSVTGEYLATDFEGDNVGGLIGFRGEGNGIVTEGCSVSGLTVAGSRKVGGLIGSVFTDNIVEDCTVSNVKVVCNASKEYGTSFINSSAMAIGGMLGLYTANGQNNGTLKNCTVENITLEVENPELAASNKVTMGYVSGGQRGNNAPADTIGVENIKVSGNNTGSNAEEKFPGSVAMNGSNSVFEQGTGTAADPYMIRDKADLTKFAASVTKTGLKYDGQYIKVADDVTFDLTDGTQIGSSSKKFMGTFDGNDVTIKGITKGLFAYVKNATIKNINLIDVNITGAYGSKGALVNMANGICTIEGITVSGNIEGGDSTGGVLGRWENSGEETLTISNCVNNAAITGKGKLGGILGYAKSDAGEPHGKVIITNCSNTGDVTPTDKGGYAGGIAGMVKFAEVSNCSNTGNITGDAVAGGIIGTIQQKDSIISDCINEGNISSKTFAGGIMGESSSGANVISRCANLGTVSAGPVAPEWWSSGNPGPMAGGITGGSRADGDSYDNCYNNGSVEATGENAFAAGITAYYTVRPVTACFNEGVVTATDGNEYQIGESKKWLQGATVPGGQTIGGCYYKDGDKIFLSDSNGTGVGAEQEGMTRSGLADALNTAGGIDNFWQAQNGSVQPDKLIPGAFDDEELRVVVITDKEGNVIEGYKSLEDAVAAAKDGQTVKLEKDVELTDTLNVTGNKEITLDINGKSLTLKKDTNKVLMNVGVKGGGDSSKLVLTDSGTTKGKIESAENAAPICVRKDASMITKDVVIVFSDENHDNSNVAIQVQGELTVEKGTNITSSEGGISVIEEGSKLTFNYGTVTAEYYAITGNGTQSGSTITVKGGVLKANDGAGIYHPQDGILVLEGGEITGKTGVQMCAGELDIPKNSTVKVIATGKDQRGDKGAGDGVIIDGAAVSIVNRDYPGGAPTVNIKGGSFVAEKTDNAVLAYTWDAQAEGDKYSQWEGAGEQVAISGGVYNTPIDEELMADGFALNEPDKDGNYGVHKHDMTKFEQKDATCEEEGLSKTYYACDVCGKYFEDEVGDGEITDVESLVIPAKGHQYDDRGKCTVCGVLTLDAEAANKVDTLIDAIGSADKVTLDSYDAIMAAKKAYEALTSEQKALVTGLDDLNAAIDAYNALLEADKNDLAGKPIDKPDKNDGTEKEDGKNPQTGDNTSMLPFILLAITAVAVAGTTVAVRRREEK